MQKNRLVWEDKTHCSGCGVCALKCTHKAIRMTPDEEGFMYPVINEDKCVNCALCQKVCHEENSSVLNVGEHRYYGMVLRDHTMLMKSSSGGAFSALCSAMDEDAIICGSTFDENLKAHHLCVENNEDGINRLRKSKYLQSDLREVCAEIKAFLKEGRKVLFTGTACQVAALYSYLGGKPDNLYTVDLICHGVPNQLIFDRYISSLQSKTGMKINRYSFREKHRFLNDWEIGVNYGNDNKMVYRAWGEDCYMTGFLRGLFYRPVCYSCRYSNAEIKRPADITIADFWGSEKLNKELNSKRGSSLLISNNSKGKELIEKIKVYALLIESPEELAISHNHNLFEPTKINPKREEFFREFSDNNDFEAIIRSLYKGPKSHSQKVRVLMELLFPWLVKMRRKKIVNERNNR